MTDQITDDELVALMILAADASRGPWHWAGSKNSHSGPFLATWFKGRGRYMVMGFRRLGMQRAQPTFRDEHHFMVPALGLAIREVDYRDDIVDIDNPDARWIAAASPEKIAAIVAELLRRRADDTAKRQTSFIEPL